VTTNLFQWTGTTAPWRAEQERVRRLTRIEPLRPLPRFVAGVDCAFSRPANQIRAAAVVFDCQTKQIVEEHAIERPCTVPYVPTFLTFREASAILEVIGLLKHAYGAILFDGQGIAHPRRCGLATHIGVLLNVPSVGVAKSRLIGAFADVPPAAGSYVPLMDKAEQIGVVYRSREKTKPLFVSVGHRMDLDSAIALVQACQTRYRLPEPTRLADKLSKFR
jgi:deoxyribonuclease V